LQSVFSIQRAPEVVERGLRDRSNLTHVSSAPAMRQRRERL